ncbi:hypothetical protein ASPZODRAFT_2115362 [Penicilliopsis zonata CBS 506.65]|uniref:Major facilitator superfamily (MFS) profile domain-containing protein n=1 Tax=Penicilliopsis zonata CBS 506.65 TaxID=1073090 RepID=A0A1L9SR22_9EURO|nr:hypothetical protein ASPZODRAFT_2115362 [Penicilliopsis zonata CBS 506.65]OJJ49675.1 hypothetical protein ASPZODRAFT_2115362 [Penicilliopsis zonata CBS 506.65]
MPADERSVASSAASEEEYDYSIDEEGRFEPTTTPGAAEAALEKQTTAASGTSALEQRAQSVISRIRSREPGQIARFTHPLSHTKTLDDVIVDFDGPDDPYRPLNWGFWKKAVTTVLYGLTTMGATWASSVYSPGVDQISKEFHIGTEVSTLGIALLLFGFGLVTAGVLFFRFQQAHASVRLLGPLIWAPLSELYGRKPAVLAPYFVAAVFSFGTAAAKDVQTIMITRFFTGFFGSAPVTNTGGVLSDIWTPEQRGAAIVGYAMAVVGGPVLGPIVGGALTQSYLGWRWTEYITGIMMMLFLILDIIFLDESYPPALLVAKAQRLRFETGNWALHARHEEWDVSLKEIGNKYLVRPFQLLTTPICFCVALYASFVYGILYLSLAAFPIEFEEIRGWNLVVGALPFLAYLVGILFGAAANLLNQRFYVKRFKANNNRAVPEARLPPMMFGSVFFAGGLFIFGWTGSKDIHWIGPVMGAVSMGLGFFTIFQAALNYLIDTFQKYSASAVAANTFLRSVFAGTFPLFANAMFHKLGVDWAASVLGFFAIALIPIPYIFYIYGRRIRAKGKWSRASVY